LIIQGARSVQALLLLEGAQGLTRFGSHDAIDNAGVLTFFLQGLLNFLDVLAAR
jgi:hypothetical protein